MYAEYLVINDRRERQEVEHVREVAPHVWRAVLPHAFCVEAVGLTVVQLRVSSALSRW